jgi:hypothetical protein
MLILKCTQKAAKELGVKRETLPQISPEDNQTLLGDWFVNLLKFGRNKALLFVNVPTLYSILSSGYHKKELAEIGQLFQTNLRFHLLLEGFEPAKIDRILAEYQKLRLAKTDSRSVLGSMNDLAGLYELQIRHQGGLSQAHLVEIIQVINRTPQLTRDGKYSIDLLKECLLAT